jgi:hypothetical protein
LHADCLAIQIFDRVDVRVTLSLDVEMSGVGNRACEVERLAALLGDDGRRDGDVILAGADTGQDAGPGQDFLANLERRIFAQIVDHLVVETGWLAVLHEFEWTEIILGCDDEVTALLDFIETRGLRLDRQR